MTLEALFISGIGIGFFMMGLYDYLEAQYYKHDVFGLCNMVVGCTILAIGLLI